MSWIRTCTNSIHCNQLKWLYLWYKSCRVIELSSSQPHDLELALNGPIFGIKSVCIFSKSNSDIPLGSERDPVDASWVVAHLKTHQRVLFVNNKWLALKLNHVFIWNYSYRSKGQHCICDFVLKHHLYSLNINPRFVVTSCKLLNSHICCHLTWHQ